MLYQNKLGDPYFLLHFWNVLSITFSWTKSKNFKYSFYFDGITLITTLLTCPSKRRILDLERGHKHTFLKTWKMDEWMKWTTNLRCLNVSFLEDNTFFSSYRRWQIKKGNKKVMHATWCTVWPGCTGIRSSPNIPRTLRGRYIPLCPNNDQHQISPHRIVTQKGRENWGNDHQGWIVLMS